MDPTNSLLQHEVCLSSASGFKHKNTHYSNRSRFGGGASIGGKSLKFSLLIGQVEFETGGQGANKMAATAGRGSGARMTIQAKLHDNLVEVGSLTR